MSSENKTSGLSATPAVPGSLLLGAFQYCTPLSSIPHDPVVHLTSNCIRAAFGETVQRVADALASRGPSSLKQITHCILVLRTGSAYRSSQQHPQRSSGRPIISMAAIRAALLVLLQHSIVTCQSATLVGGAVVAVKRKLLPISQQQHVIYKLVPKRALAILFYPKFLEWLKKAHGNDMTVCTSLEVLLQAGRMRTADWIAQTALQVGNNINNNSNNNNNNTSNTSDGNNIRSDRYTARQMATEAIYKLVRAGLIERVQSPPLSHVNDGLNDNRMDPDAGETEMDDMRPPAMKKIKLESQLDNSKQVAVMEGHDGDSIKREQDDLPFAAACCGNTKSAWNDDDPAVVALIYSHANYRAALPIDMVWRVHVAAFVDCLRALAIGKMISERFAGPNKVPAAGSLVTAALRYRAHKKYGMRDSTAAGSTAVGGGRTAGDPRSGASGHDDTMFDHSFVPIDTMKFLPKPVLQNMEKRVGGVAVHLSQAWQTLSEQHHPAVADRVSDDRFDVDLYSLMDFLRQRVMHQIIQQRHGQLAARIVTILTKQGWLESDVIAQQAMIPAKDTRELLHKLYRSQYVGLFPLSTTRQHNPGATIYLWTVEKKKLLRKITEDVMTALWNIRLRRQHQVGVGKEWIERAQQAEADENDNEDDKVNYQRFCMGLERLDQASLQLAETLLILLD